MTSDIMIRSLFRALETSMHERLAMIEDAVRLRLESESDSIPHEEESGRIRALEEQIALLSDRLAMLETRREETNEVHVHRVGSKGEEIWIEPMRDLKIELDATPVAAPAAPVPHVIAAVSVPTAPLPVAMNTIVEEEVVEEEVEEEVVEEEVEEEVVEEEVEEEVVEEEEEGVQVEVFEYKGKTYFRDDTHQVYAPSQDDPEQPDETPVGTWDPVRNRILFRRTA